MAFYYLHKTGEPAPKNENGFKYIIYSDNRPSIMTELSFDPGIHFCPHKIDGVTRWEVDDEFIDIETHENTTTATFKKVYEERGLTIWKNEMAK